MASIPLSPKHRSSRLDKIPLEVRILIKLVQGISRIGRCWVVSRREMCEVSHRYNETPPLNTNATMRSPLSHPADHVPPLWNVPSVSFIVWESLSMLACRREGTPAITSDATGRPRIRFWVTRAEELVITSCHRQGHSVVVAQGQQDRRQDPTH